VIEFKGLCRIKGENGEPNRVRVTDGDLFFDDVTEEDYRSATFKPPLEELTWCSPKKETKG